MKRIITILIMAMSLSMLSAQEIDKIALRMAVERQFSDYPESTLQDIYKAFYQEHFGPEHMISDIERVGNYLKSELSMMGEDRSRVYFESIGVEGNYVRVYLDAITDGLVTAAQLLQAFVESANAGNEPAIDWATKWEAIVEVVDEIKPGFGSEERELLRQASLNDQAVHHSRAYSAAYHPHYRIVERNIFEKNMLNQIIGR